MQRVGKLTVANAKRTGAKLIYGLMTCLLVILIGSPTALAGWRIDGARFSQSFHSDTTCVDCHTEIEELSRHPEPANVNKKMADFFDAEMCLACHDDVQSQIEDDAEHGGETVDDVQRFFNCIECHDPHYEGAPDEAEKTEEAYEPSEDNASCMACHQTVHPDDPDKIQKNQEFCMACHATGKEMPPMVPVMDPEQLAKTPHATLDCFTCHPKADQYEHNKQVSSDCGECHQPHEESVAHEAHVGVSCEACHLGDVAPIRDEKTNEVLWVRSFMPGAVSTLHNLTKPDGEGCARCHFKGNDVGAASLILPAKSVICMPCHPATFTAADTTTIVSLVVFAFGMLCFMSLWFSGSFAGAGGGIGNALGAVKQSLAVVFSNKLGIILKTIWNDVLLQRRLKQRSAKRWAIHALIFWPFVIRFVWGILALISTNYLKGWPLAWALINKNHPITAFIFDVTGICLIVGIVLAFMRGSEADKTRTEGLPNQDRLALILIGAIAVIGFVLEGMRIALTGAEGSAAYAFIGYGISKLFITMKGLSEIYGYFWYLHAILTGAFLAYLPFSRMLHIIMSPVVMIMNAVTQKEHH